MRSTESIELKGRLSLALTNRAGQTVLQQTASNMVVTTGRDLVAKLFSDVEIAPINFVAVGTSEKPVDENDQSLGAQLGDRKPFLGTFDPSAHLSTVGEGAEKRKKITRTVELDFTEANGELREAGLFNAAADGIMYNRVVFPTITKTDSFKLTLIWEILF